MTLIAYTHTPSSALAQCALTYLTPQPIDMNLASRQHQAYCEMLRAQGLHVVVSTCNRGFPDSVFVEDAAIMLDEIGIQAPMGIASRRSESRAVGLELARYRNMVGLDPPARLEGGDVLRIGRRLFVGQSRRTDSAGLERLRRWVDHWGYMVTPVQVHGCLHLKTGCTALDDHTVLLNPEWIDPAVFEDYTVMPVSLEEPFAANILRIQDVVCVHAGHVKTRRRIAASGYPTIDVDISEFLKAEAGLTCLSVIFKYDASTR